MTRRVRLWGRVAATVAAIVIGQAIACAMAAWPVVLAWFIVQEWLPASAPARAVVYSVLAAPSYVVFALGLMLWSPILCRVTGARTPENVTLRIASFEWPLLRWAQYAAAAHVVRLVAGSLFRGSPVWTYYLRLNGARIGRRVFVNSLSVGDHNLLELGDDVLIGADVHLSGHTVENGLLKTGRVTLGRGVTVGLGSVVDIDVVVGDGCQIGALSLVPKHTRLAARGVYAGVPVKPLAHHDAVARDRRLTAPASPGAIRSGTPRSSPPA
jgi:acetyltransferase-like isoleucine patch superfamily enzyme